MPQKGIKQVSFCLYGAVEVVRPKCFLFTKIQWYVTTYSIASGYTPYIILTEDCLLNEDETKSFYLASLNEQVGTRIKEALSTLVWARLSRLVDPVREHKL